MSVSLDSNLKDLTYHSQHSHFQDGSSAESIDKDKVDETEHEIGPADCDGHSSRVMEADNGEQPCRIVHQGIEARRLLECVLARVTDKGVRGSEQTDMSRRSTLADTALEETYPPSWLMAMIIHAVKTARPVAGVVKIRLVTIHSDSLATLSVTSCIEISIDLIFACLCSADDVL